MEKGSRNKVKKDIKSTVVEREKGYRKEGEKDIERKEEWLQDMETRSNRQDKRKIWMEAELS